MDSPSRSVYKSQCCNVQFYQASCNHFVKCLWQRILAQILPGSWPMSACQSIRYVELCMTSLHFSSLLALRKSSHWRLQSGVEKNWWRSLTVPLLAASMVPLSPKPGERYGGLPLFPNREKRGRTWF